VRAALAALVALAVACTASGDPVAAYLDRLERTLIDGADTVREIVPPRTAVTRTHVVEVTEARRSTLIALEALQPPPDLGPEHTALISTYTAFVEESQDFLDSTAGLNPDEFLEALESSDEVAASQGLFQTACQAMVSRAAELGHPDVALDCSA
jgi:hypothetical protein